MTGNYEELKVRIFNKIQKVKAAQERAARHVANFDSNEYSDAINEAEQGIRDIERMVA
jgi:hypothetical protein